MKHFQTYVKPYVRKYRMWMVLAVLFGFLTMIGSTMLTFTSGYLISSAALMPYNILMLYVPIVLVRTFGISQAVTRYLERLFGHNAVLKILADMRVKLYEMLEPQALLIRSRFKTGDLLGTLADDIEHLQDVYIRTIFPVATALFVFLGTILSLAWFDLWFALWIGVCLSFIVFLYPLFSLWLLKKQQLKQKEAKNRLYSSLGDAVLGLSDWLISGRKASFINRFVEERKDHTYFERKIAHWHQTRELHLRILSGVILIMVGIWAGVEAQSGTIAPAYIAAFTLVTLPIIEGLIPVSAAIERIPTYQDSLNRLAKIEGKPVKKERGITPVLTEGEIKIENLSYRYEQSEFYALQQINLTIPTGSKIALLGRSGAGKTTLLQILLGELRPSEGTVEINQQPSTLYGENIYELISVLNQKPYLFNTSVENNIRLGNQMATKEEIEAVVKQVKLGEYIQSLPEGLGTQMEETGSRFSGGERQRIALARILLKNTPIVILDEPTVGLDPQTEADLMETIFTVLKGKTVIWITHHLMGMEKMDKILFMEKGKIVLNGSHQQLLKESERYQRLYELDHGI